MYNENWTPTGPQLDQLAAKNETAQTNLTAAAPPKNAASSAGGYYPSTSLPPFSTHYTNY